jgi:hypothetical protein
MRSSLSSIVRSVLLESPDAVKSALDSDSPEREEQEREHAEISSKAHGDAWFRVFFENFDMKANVETPVGADGRSLEDLFRRDNDKFILALERDHGVSGKRPLKMLGYGFQGVVWQLPDGNVMKTTEAGAEEAYDRAVDTMRLHQRGDPAGVSSLRVLDAFKIVTRGGYGDVSESPWSDMSPHHRFTAVIMDKLVPSDKHPEVERAMRDLLHVFAQEMQFSCLQFVRPDRRQHYVEAIENAPTLEDLRQNGVSPSQILLSEENRHTGWKEDDIIPDIDIERALRTVAQTFLARIDKALASDLKASQAILELPTIVGRELHIRLNTSGDRKNPVWLQRMKAAFAREMERGGWDVVTDNFGIDSKGDIIPFDM